MFFILKIALNASIEKKDPFVIDLIFIKKLQFSVNRSCISSLNGIVVAIKDSPSFFPRKDN